MKDEKGRIGKRWWVNQAAGGRKKVRENMALEFMGQPAYYGSSHFLVRRFPRSPESHSKNDICQPCHSKGAQVHRITVEANLAFSSPYFLSNALFSNEERMS
jgi:hypothetical protein